MRLLFTLALLCIVFTFGECGGVTPSPTSSNSGSWSPSASISWSPSTSASWSPSASASWSPSGSSTGSTSLSASASSSVTVSATASVSTTSSISVSVSTTGSVSWSPSISVTGSISISASPSGSISNSASASPSISASPSTTPSANPSIVPIFAPGDDPSMIHGATVPGVASVEFPPNSLTEGSTVEGAYIGPNNIQNEFPGVEAASGLILLSSDREFLLPFDVCFTSPPLNPSTAFCLGSLNDDMEFVCLSELVPGSTPGEYCGMGQPGVMSGAYALVDKSNSVSNGVGNIFVPVSVVTVIDRPVTVMVPYFIDVPNPIPNPRPFAIPVPVERPVPFPEFVDNPVPVPVANPVAVDVPYGVSVINPVPVDVPRPVANPIMIDVPYPVALPVAIVVDVPVFVAAPHNNVPGAGPVPDVSEISFASYPSIIISDDDGYSANTVSNTPITIFETQTVSNVVYVYDDDDEDDNNASPLADDDDNNSSSDASSLQITLLSSILVAFALFI